MRVQYYPMKVSFDISALPYGTGVSRYTTNLVRELANITKEFQLQLFGASLRGYRQLDTFCQTIETPAKLYPIPPSITGWLFTQTGFPIERLTGKTDIFHTWDWYAPKTNKALLFTTVHDLALFKDEQISHPKIRNQHLLALNRVKKHNGHFICVSKTTQEDLIRLFEVEPRRTHVVPEAMPAEVMIEPNISTQKQVLKTYGISRPYLLIVGTLEPRKNINRMIKAWRWVKEDFDLVLAGNKSWDKISPEPGLHLIGYVSPVELAGLYRRAEALLYCSLDEGFGLPILEAFYHQTPVVTSNTGSMPEVAGKAAILVNPNEVSDIISGIERALESRNELVRRGKKRLKLFSWQQAAKDTLKAYKKALGGNS